MENRYIKDRYLSSMTPRDLAYELLDKAVSDMALSREAFQSRRFEEANRLLIETQKIFAELCGSLRGQDEASKHGAALFRLLMDELFYVNLNMELDRLEEIRQLTEQLKITYGAQLGKLRFE